MVGKIYIHEHGYSVNKLICMSMICLIICVGLLPACTLFEKRADRDFTMDGEILLAYTGENAVVDIPENVSKIEGNTFGFSPNASEITTINLGANVKNIDLAAFCGLSSLSSISVSKENPHFLSVDNFLLTTNGSIIFCFGTSKPDINYLINKLSEDSIDIPLYKDGYKLIFNDAVLSFTEYPSTDRDIPTIEDGILVEMSAKGHTVKFTSPINYYGDHAWTVFEADSVIVFSDLIHGSVGDTYVFTDEGLYEQHNSENDIFSDYNSPIVVFGLGEDGKLTYTCQPIKFVNSGSDSVYLQYCVGVDEIYIEYGTAIFENGQPIYTAKTQTSVVEHFGKDELKESYRLFRDFALTQGSDISNSLEEYLKNNANKYIKFDPEILN